MLRRPARLALSIAALTALLALAAPGRVDGAEHPLDRRLTLDLWGAGLNDVAKAVKAATGVDIVFFLPDLPLDKYADNVYIVTGEVTLATVLEALARRFSFRFSVAESGRVELSRGYGWIPLEPALRFSRMNCLYPSADCSPANMRAFLSEFIKPLSLLPGGFSLRVETYPVQGNPGHLRSTAVLPRELADNLDQGVRCLSGEAGDYPAPRPGARLFAQAREYDGDWEKLLARQVQVPRGDSLRALLADVARQTGVAIVLRAPPSREGRLDPDVVRYTLGRICETLSNSWGLGKRVFLSSGAVVFERGAGDVFETDARSRELFWGGLAVAGFDAKRAAEACGGGSGLVALLRREVFPGVWRDPACALVYSPVSGRLAVVAPCNVIEALARRLAAFPR